MKRLSCHRFGSNEVGLWLSLIAYNLGNLWRRLVLPKDRRLALDELAATVGQDGWAVGEARRLLLLMLAESHLTRRLFGSIVRRIEALRYRRGRRKL